MPLLQNKDFKGHEYLYYEHEGNKAVAGKKWKLVKERGASDWELFNMDSDKTELNNIADSMPELTKELKDRWKKWAKECNVVEYGCWEK
jgi:arylsulfatase